MNLLNKMKNSNYNYVLIMLSAIFHVIITAYVKLSKHTLINDFLLIITLLYL